MLLNEFHGLNAAIEIKGMMPSTISLVTNIDKSGNAETEETSTPLEVIRCSGFAETGGSPSRVYQWSRPSIQRCADVLSLLHRGFGKVGVVRTSDGFARQPPSSRSPGKGNRCSVVQTRHALKSRGSVGRHSHRFPVPNEWLRELKFVLSNSVAGVGAARLSLGTNHRTAPQSLWLASQSHQQLTGTKVR